MWACDGTLDNVRKCSYGDFIRPTSWIHFWRTNASSTYNLIGNLLYTLSSIKHWKNDWFFIGREWLNLIDSCHPPWVRGPRTAFMGLFSSTIAFIKYNHCLFFYCKCFGLLGTFMDVRLEVTLECVRAIGKACAFMHNWLSPRKVLFEVNSSPPQR